MISIKNILQHKINAKKLSQVWSPPTTSGLEMEWDYFHRTGRYGKAKKLMKRVRKERKLK